MLYSQNLQTHFVKMNLKPNLFDELSELFQQQIWGYLDQRLELDFDFVKLVAFEWHVNDFENKMLDDITPLFWVTRQGEDPFSSLVEHEIKWIKKYLGQEETDIIVADFGAADSRVALLYLVDDNSKRVELTVLTVDYPDSN